jgi:endonuclease G, mitochondrial
MTNMVPQAPDCNRIVWKALEDYERELVQEGNELYIFAGPCGTGGTSADGSFTEIPLPERNTSGRITTDADGNAVPSGRNIPVPAFIWKIILVLPEGDNDLSRITAQTCIIVVEIPNKQGCGSTGSWQQYETNVDSIESATGFDFFDLLDDTVEDKLESTVSHYE